MVSDSCQCWLLCCGFIPLTWTLDCSADHPRIWLAPWKIYYMYIIRTPFQTRSLKSKWCVLYARFYGRHLGYIMITLSLTFLVLVIPCSVFVWNCCLLPLTLQHWRVVEHWRVVACRRLMTMTTRRKNQRLMTQIPILTWTKTRKLLVMLKLKETRKENDELSQKHIRYM